MRQDRATRACAVDVDRPAAYSTGVTPSPGWPASRLHVVRVAQGDSMQNIPFHMARVKIASRLDGSATRLFSPSHGRG